MPGSASNTTVVIRASIAGYIALGAIWIILGGFFVYLAFTRPGGNIWCGAVTCFSVAVAFWVWLRGFKIILSDQWFEYRDGFFRTTGVPTPEIEEVKVEWVSAGHHLAGRKIPRLLVIARNGTLTIRVNPKPFSRRDLRKIFERFPAAPGVAGDGPAATK
jgi:hypothetical protein